MQKLLEALAATAELMGQQLSPNAAAMMVNDLKEYNPTLINEALACLRKDTKARFSIGWIIEKIESLTVGGRPSPDEAWAMIPKDEHTSAVISNEMAHALRTAQPLIDDGDKIAARMAFKDAYTNIVNFNKQHGIKTEWFPSLGFDKVGHMPALADAVRAGRLSKDHALGLIAPEETESFLQLAGIKHLALENKPSEIDMENIRKIKLMLSHSNIGKLYDRYI